MAARSLVTGATGFVGGPLVDALLARGDVQVRVLVRDVARSAARWGAQVEVAEIDLARPPSSSANPCEGVDSVFHLAGHAHAEDEGSGRSDELHQEVTVGGTRWLLARAAEAGVRRLVFLSSVKAMGEETRGTADEGAPSAPTTAYGRAKRAAEELVLASRRPEGVVLRSPLVYGPGVKGNLQRMMGAVRRGRFPPLPAVDNRRSMIDVRDLVTALCLLEREPRAAGRVFIATDGEAYSTRRIFDAMVAAAGRRAPRVSIPLPLLRAGGRVGDLLGRAGLRAPLTSARVDKLFSDADYSNRALVALGFHPAHRLETALPDMLAAARDG
jgi:UDP-glucose 4-epimerase